jgi:serine/threonine protein kinase/Flp pilus assembly protein TadD
MEHKDWLRVEELFLTALEMKGEERNAYLAQVRSQYPLLHAEVESLLAAFENRPEFIERPAFSLGLKLLGKDYTDQTLVGQLIGPYRILRLLGEGGMGKVYLAEDVRLDRRVALKFLSTRLVDGAWAKRRLIKEAQAVAKVDHASICTVYGFEEYDGHNFIVMQYIEGETLASLIRKGLLKPKQIPQLAFQIASALAEAHSHDIIHRDIKPQNIMVMTTGQVKVLDFGLAKLVQKKSPITPGDSQSHDSQMGLVIGTVAYMSPEQLRAERIDFRSDIFSFGVVLYEMIIGANPFRRGSNAETISAVLTNEPPPLTNLHPDVPAVLARVAHKCLNKDREKRYQSASEVLLDLDNPQKSVATRTLLPLRLKLRTRLALALLFLLTLVAGLVYPHLMRPLSIAVLPIVNRSASADTGFLCEGLTDALIFRLSRLSKLRVKSPTIVPSYDDQETANKKLGHDFNVDVVVFGSVLPRGDSTILQVVLLKAADGSAIWREEYPIAPGEMLVLQEQLYNKVVSELHISLSEDDKKLSDAHQTENLEAYNNYLLGRHYHSKRNKENIQKAINHFTQAIELDPLYAQAHAALACCYALLPSVAYGSLPTNEAMWRARKAAKTALEIDDKLCEAHTALALVKLKYDWDWQEAEREFIRAISLNADYAPAHYYYSNLLALTGRWDQSITESETAKELDPFSPLSNIGLGRAFYYARQYDRAARFFNKMLEANPDDSNALYMLGYVYLQQRLYKESIEAFNKVYSVNKTLAAAPLGYTLAKAGRTTEALKILDELEEQSKQSYVPAQERAIIYVGLDYKEQALTLLEEACKERFAAFPFLMAEPVMVSLRSDSRFADLARCANVMQ